MNQQGSREDSRMCKKRSRSILTRNSIEIVLQDSAILVSECTHIHRIPTQGCEKPGSNRHVNTPVIRQSETHCPQYWFPSMIPTLDIHLGLLPNSRPSAVQAHLKVSLSPPHILNQKSLSSSASIALTSHRAARFRPPFPDLSMMNCPVSNVQSSNVHV